MASFNSTSPQCHYNSMDFSDTTTGGELPYTSYSWDFGDGFGNSTEQNPSYHYSAVGIYNVTLQVTDSASNNDTYWEEVQVISDADLEIGIVGSSDLVFADQALTYNVTVSNGGPCDAFEVVVTDALPSVMSNPEYSMDDGETWLPYSGTVDLVTMANGAVKYVLIKATAGCPAICTEVIANTATVDSLNYDPAPANNSANTTTTVGDNTPPAIISSPGNVTIECIGDIPPADIGGVAATDNCGNVTVTHTGDADDGNTCPKTIIRTYQATDDCGNSANVTQTITVNDTVTPVITSSPGNVTVECIGDVPPPDIGNVTATDNCGNVTVTHVGDVDDGYTCPRTVTRIYQATDACGNYANVTQTIAVNDTVAPVITSSPGNITVECIGDIPPADIGNVTATDNCGNVTVIHVVDVDDGNTCPKTVTRIYQATDACGNYANVTQTIAVNDTVAPVITSSPGNITVECIADIPPADIGNVTATDNCGNVTVIHVVDVNDGNTCPRIVIRVYKATDYCGNSANVTQTITVNDTVAPVITSSPGNVTVECIGDVPPPDIGNVTATDNCGNVTVTHVGDADDGSTCPKIITRTYQATDKCGNYANVTQAIAVDDSIAPVITCAANVTIECDETTDPSKTGNATATDNCDTDVEVSYSDTSDGGPCPESITRTWTATDDCGNAAQCIQFIERVQATPTPTPIPVTVGGTILPPDKIGLVMPWLIAAIALVALVAVSLVVWSWRRGSP